MLFICPKCKEQLTNSENNTAKCRNGHAFDRAKEGYFNLLLGAGGGTHGDNPEMVLARRNFLSTDSYLPLAEAVTKAVLAALPEGGRLLDIGCGEGYYTGKIAEALADCDRTSDLYAFDISKDAVKRAAKRVPSGHFAVASAYDMPFSDATFDLAVNLFSPLAIGETARVLKPGGRFLYVIPGEEHLFGLKKVLYDTPYKNEPQDTALQDFTLAESERICYSLCLSGKEKISALFGMTPYAYRTAKEGRERLLSLETLETEIDFYLLSYEKNGGTS